MIDTFLTRLSAGIATFFADPFASEPSDATHRDVPSDVADDRAPIERPARDDDYAPFSWALHGHW